jgi:transketolase
VWVLCGDSDDRGLDVGGLQHAGWEKLANLTAIIDVNRLGETRETMLDWVLDGYVMRIEAFG